GMRKVMARVLPVPAPARMSRGPSVVSAARRCSGFSCSRRESIGPFGRFFVTRKHVSRGKGGAQIGAVERDCRTQEKMQSAGRSAAQIDIKKEQAVIFFQGDELGNVKARVVQ